MTTVAKGSFPGRPRKKLHKRKIKFQKKLHKNDLGHLGLACSYISHVTDQFHAIFDDGNEKDVEFIGFSSEECGLRAYKRVNKRPEEPSPSSADILRSDHTPLKKEKVITRRAHALDQSTSSSLSQSISSSSNSLHGSPSKNDSCQSRSTDPSTSSCDSAFLKYKNFKLDFHRLSKKAKNRNSHADCSAEEQAKRKDTSTASLKYASDIYLAKNHAVLGQAKSPIKPATFIPPASHLVMHSSPTSQTSLKIKKGVRLKSDNQEQKKGSGHPEVIAKALLARANRGRKPESSYSPSRFQQSKDRRPKSPRGFVLPMKSARSARIIKANRKYMDEDDIRQIDDRAVTSREEVADVDSPNSVTSSVPVIYPHEDPEEGKENVESELVCLSPRVDNPKHKKSRRKPLIKEPTFRIRDTKCNAGPAGRIHKSRKEGYGSTGTQVRARCVIKRARFKHPTSSDALLRGPDHIEDRPPHQVSKNPIRPPTFTTPATKKRDCPSKCPETPQPSSPVGSEPELSDLGLSSGVWRKLCDASHRKWVVGSCERVIPVWTVQEIHNLLHGAHTFGGAWCTIARQYDFHELHRDANSVSMKGKACQKLDLLNNSYKVKSSILLQLKPKLSEDPNVTVFTPKELSVRGMSSNVHCNINTDKQRQRYFFNTAAERVEERKRELAQKLLESSSNDFKHTVVNLEDISRSDLCLGLPEGAMTIMLRPKFVNERKKVLWTPWEIHNILHGIHYFGIGSWAQISAMYTFLKTHNNIAIRGKFKSVCCRDLIVARKVRPDILKKLHVVLSSAGKAYFFKNKISVTICGLTKSEETTTPRGSQTIDGMTRRGKRKKMLRGRSRHLSYGSDDSDNDQAPISPRRMAVHLFGTVPVWDESKHCDVVDSNSDNGTNALKTTPVLEALEDGLRRNMSPVPKSSTVSSSDHSLASPPQPSVDAKTNSETKTRKTSNQRARSASRDKPRPVTKTKGRGPRIKHVCRRASLVTGETRATFDHSPHLSALPRDEREKIAAQAEKSKVNGAPSMMSSSESDDGKTHHSKPTNQTTARRERQSRKRSLNHRCGTCDACKEPPCKACDGCREPVTVAGSSVAGTWNCFARDPCINPITHESTTQAKRCKRNPSEYQPASRKSSRLMQQRIPLKSVQIEDTSFLNVKSTVTCHATNSDSLTASFPGLSSPGCENDVFGTKTRNEALIKVDDWKDTYDLDLLWKCGGHALITSSPSPPRAVCFLCGSRGLPGDEVDALVFCSSCCEPFHGYCADDNFDQPNVKKAMTNGTWLCRRCQYCQVCGHPDDLLTCRQCRKTYHCNCLGSSYPIKPSTNKSWVCLQCVRCSSCGSSKPGNLPGSSWTHDCTMCQRCGDLYDKGNYCTICRKCYRDEDYECRMMQCATCKRWIHSKCESLTVEMYTLLTHMPDNVQYECPECDERGVNLRTEFGDDFLKKDQQSFACDLEKVRLFIHKLPDPPWKKAILEETQVGLEAIIMALFHHKATYCILKKNETLAGSNNDNTVPTTDPSRPRDLFAVRFAVHSRRYRSIGAFCSDVRHVLSSLQDVADRTAVEKAFREEASSVFSWFNFETGRIRDSDDLPDDLLPDAVLPPFPEHDYAQCLDKDIPLPGGTPDPSPVKPCLNTLSHIPESSPLKESEDLRQCLFCSKYGDDKATGCGRLLYCGQDEWCHVNCALWSAEVYEQHDGSLENVHSAASRGKMLKCDHCRLPGATVGCNTRDCPKNYHFMCARNANCAFQEDKKIFCARHLNHAKEAIGDDGFVVERLVCVDNDEMRPNRRWQRGMLACSISVSIGSLTAHQLGKLGYASDSRECLTPITYRMTRVFWSTFRVGMKVVYTITVMEQRPSNGDNQADSGSADHTNMTISHNSQEEDTAKHRSKPETSPFTSPPHLCRTDLMERLKEKSGIGPLSRRSIRNKSSQPFSSDQRTKGKPASGTYTIISNINKTLPQAITPLPPDHLPSSVSSMDTNHQFFLSESKEKDETPSYSENPFLNKTTLQPAQTVHNKNDSIKPPTSGISIAPVFSDSPLAKLANSEPNNKVRDRTSETNIPSASFPTAVSSCSAKKSDVLLLANSNSTPLAIESKSKASVSCASNLQTGSSGALVNKIANQPPENSSLSFTGAPGSLSQTFGANFVIGCDAEIRPNLSKASDSQSSLSFKTTLNDLSDEADGMKESESEKDCIVKKATSLTRQPSPSNEKTTPTPTSPKGLSTDDVPFFNCPPQMSPVPTFVSKSITSGIATDSQPSATVSTTTPVISLIQDARFATDMESQEVAKIPEAESPSLWWHKRDSKPKKEHNFKRDQDSSKQDPSYEVPPSEQHLWKKKNGESSLDAAHRNRKRVMGKRACKVVQDMSTEDDIDTECETEILSTSVNTKTLRSKKDSLSLKEKKDNVSVKTTSQLKQQITTRGRALQRIATEAKKSHSSLPRTQLGNSSPKLLGKDHNNDLKMTIKDEKVSDSEKFDTSNVRRSCVTDASSVLKEVDSEISSSSLELSETDSLCNFNASMGSLERGFADSLYESPSTRGFSAENNTDCSNSKDLSCIFNKTYSHVDIEGDLPSHANRWCATGGVRPSNTTSDDEMAAGLSPKTKLRKFAHKSPRNRASKPDEVKKSKEKDRQRSKSHEAPLVSGSSAKKAMLPLIPETALEARLESRESSHITSATGSSGSSLKGLHLFEASESSMKNDAATSRRYPRRNTYTCLKSFSGLSPNYALASYSRKGKFIERPNKMKRSMKKADSLSASTSKEDVANVIDTRSHKPLHHRITNKLSDTAATGKDLSEHRPDEVFPTPTSPDVNDEPVPVTSTDVTSYVKQVAIRSSVSPHLDQTQSQECNEPRDQVSSDKSSHRQFCPDPLLHKDEKKIKSDENLSSHHLFGNSITSLPDDTVPGVVNGQDEVKDLVDDVLGSLDIKLESKGKDIENLPFSHVSHPHMDPNNLQLDDENDTSCFLNDSPEVLRGGGSGDEDPLPVCDKSSSSLNFTSPSEKCRLLSNLLSDIPSANPISNGDLETEDNVILTSIDSIPIDMDISSDLIETTDPSFFNNTECPVLSADEVKTLLDDSVSDAPVSCSTSGSGLVNRSAISETRLPANCSQPTPMVMTPTVFPTNANVASQYISHPLQMPMMQPLIVRSPVIPFPTESLMAVPQVQQPIPSNIVAASPVTYFSPIPEPPPVYCFPFQQYSPTIYRAPVLQSPCPVPYSLRVTMAMAGTLNSDQAVASSVNMAARAPRQKRPYHRKTVHCPRSRFAAPKRPRCKLDKPVIRTDKPLVYRPRLDTSSGLNMPKSSLLNDIQGGSILKQGEPFNKRNKQSPRRSSAEQATSSQRAQQGEFTSQEQRAMANDEVYLPKASNATNETSASSPKATSDEVSLPQQPVNQLASLEQLIEYYSAKNNLTNEEKAIVRSIINKQMQNKQLPVATNHPTREVVKPKSQTVVNSCASKVKTTTAKKRRSTSKENAKKPKKKTKDRPKEKPLVIKDRGQPLLVQSGQDANQPSVLFDIYNNRRSWADHQRKQPLTKMLTPYNIFLGNIKTSSNKENALPPPPSNSKKTKECPRLVYEIKSDDGYFAKGTDLQDLIDKLLISAQECRSMQKGYSNSTALHSVMKPRAFLGVSHDAIRFIVEQLPGARHCSQYRAKYHKHKKIKEDISHINPHGCCRAEQYKGRSKPDMFGFLASKHRIPPSFQPDKNQQDDIFQLSNRRATSMEDLPMAMRFRHLKTFSKEAVGVYRSSIHGRGLYCKRDIQDGEMILEYTGQMIRKELTDKREKHYESKSIGCYMFRMDDFYVVDATLLGSAARFINHSCDPNCYSRIVHVEGRKHIVIFALRKIYRGEELTYDYKFPIEDEMHKITCNCGARNCRKFMN